MNMQDLQATLEGLEEAQSLLARSDQNIDKPYDAIGEALRILGAVEALKVQINRYDEWVQLNHPDDHDGQDVMTYEEFDEQRADRWESIVYQAAVVTGNVVYRDSTTASFPLSMQGGE